MVQISKQVVSDVESKDTDSNFLYWLQNSNYLTGALWPVSSKAIQFAKSAILSAHSFFVEQREGAFFWMFCALVCVALCVIAKYKTTLHKFNWLKDKLPCLDSSASPADQAHHAVRAVRVKICVKTSCPR